MHRKLVNVIEPVRFVPDNRSIGRNGHEWYGNARHGQEELEHGNSSGWRGRAGG